MTKRFWMLLVCLLLACGVALAECVICGGDSVCDTCDGNGYLLMQAYGSDEQLKVACMAEGCNNGACTLCEASAAEQLQAPRKGGMHRYGSPPPSRPPSAGRQSRRPA